MQPTGNETPSIGDAFELAAGWWPARRFRGLTIDGDLALAMRMPRSAIAQVQNGHRAPTARFMARALFALHPAGFDDLFRIVPVEIGASR